MYIYYKVAERTQPGTAGGGQKKYIAMATKRQKIDLRELVEDISMKSSLSHADVIATVTALEEAIVDNIKMGRSMELGRIGIISPRIKRETRDNAKDVNFKCIKGVRLYFRPGVKIKRELKKCEFKKLG